MLASTRGLSHRPFKAESRVRIPLRVPYMGRYASGQSRRSVKPFSYGFVSSNLTLPTKSKREGLIPLFFLYLFIVALMLSAILAKCIATSVGIFLIFFIRELIFTLLLSCLLSPELIKE